MADWKQWLNQTFHNHGQQNRKMLTSIQSEEEKAVGEGNGT